MFKKKYFQNISNVFIVYQRNAFLSIKVISIKLEYPDHCFNNAIMFWNGLPRRISPKLVYIKRYKRKLAKQTRKIKIEQTKRSGLNIVET